MTLQIPERYWEPGPQALELEYPWITPGAARFLDGYVKKSHRVLDLGTGGSTLFYARRASFVVAIETEQGWYDVVRQKTDGLENVDLYLIDRSLLSEEVKGMVDCWDDEKLFDVISIDTMSPISRDELLTLVSKKARKDCVIVLDNWSDSVMFPQRGQWPAARLLQDLGLQDTHQVVDYPDPHWVGQGTRVIMPKGAIVPKLAVYMICKDELLFVERALKSCWMVDQVVVCDTGSTDGTWELLKQWEEGMGGAMTAKQVHVKPWRFDDARNAALSFIKPDIDLCISLDADEVLDANFITELKQNYDPTATRYNHRFKTCWGWEKGDYTDNVSEHWHERVHARAGYRWVLPVHERLEHRGPEVVRWLDKAWMVQYPDVAKARGSYLPLLEASVRERPDIWKSWSFLAGEYEGAGRYPQALDALRKALELPDSDKVFLHSRLGGIAERAKDFTTASAEHLTAAGLSRCREYFVWAALYFHRRGDANIARAMIAAAETFKDRTYGYEYSSSCWGDAFEATKRVING